MKLEMQVTKTVDVAFLEVSAEVRYWEDATVDGVEDTDGSLIPLKRGNLWCPVIRLSDGQVMNWPEGTVADIHYKVCDQGEYWLLDDPLRRRIAKWANHYVPDSILTIKESGYGDYIILKVGKTGLIEHWNAPRLKAEEWVAV